MEMVDREMRERLCQALEEGGRESFFAGLSLDAYLALSEEEEKDLWDRLAKEAFHEVQLVARESPSHFRPVLDRSVVREALRGALSLQKRCSMAYSRET